MSGWVITPVESEEVAYSTICMEYVDRSNSIFLIPGCLLSIFSSRLTLCPISLTDQAAMSAKETMACEMLISIRSFL